MRKPPLTCTVASPQASSGPCKCAQLRTGVWTWHQASSALQNIPATSVKHTHTHKHTHTSYTHSYIHAYTHIHTHKHIVVPKYMYNSSIALIIVGTQSLVNPSTSLTVPLPPSPHLTSTQWPQMLCFSLARPTLTHIYLKLTNSLGKMHTSQNFWANASPLSMTKAARNDSTTSAIILLLMATF